MRNISFIEWIPLHDIGINLVKVNCRLSLLSLHQPQIKMRGHLQITEGGQHKGEDNRDGHADWEGQEDQGVTHWVKGDLQMITTFQKVRTVDPSIKEEEKASHLVTQTQPESKKETKDLEDHSDFGQPLATKENLTSHPQAGSGFLQMTIAKKESIAKSKMSSLTTRWRPPTGTSSKQPSKL